MIRVPLESEWKMRPRLGFLGVGWIGLHRLKSILDSGLGEVSALADLSEEALRRAKELAPKAETCGNFETMLRRDLDGVVIATPSAHHAEQAIAALGAGKAVFCQKPLGRNAGETHSIIGAARRADRLLSVDYSYRFLKGIGEIREAVRRKEIGDIYGVDLTFHNAYGPDKPWYYNPAQSGGGCVMDLGVHLLDLMMWVLDFPEVRVVSSRLFSRGKGVGPRDGCVEDYAVAQLELGTGAAGRLSCSWRLSAGCDAEIGMTIYGTAGGYAVRNVNGSFYEFQAERLRGTSRQKIEDPTDWWGRSAVEWVRRLSFSNRFDPESENLVRVAEVMDAVYAGSGGPHPASSGYEQPTTNT